MLSQQLQFLFTLFVVFQVKQFLCDFPLQTKYMMRKVNGGWDFFMPLFWHCSVHTTFTLVIVMVVNPKMWWLAVVDFGVHFVMDRIKAGPKYLGRFNNYDRQSYWVAFGFDQMVHDLTHYFIIYQLFTSLYPIL